jgi:sugar O-acyltransferase (sialic acid O-acetyltransferase NeuD family)
VNRKILLVGGGGHCKSVLDSLLSAGNFLDIGIIDREENVGKSLLGMPIVGCDDDLPKLLSAGFKYAFVTVGSIGKPKLRIELSKLVRTIGFRVPTICDPTAVVSRHSRIESGVFIGKGAVVNAGAIIKRDAIVNTRATVEHDCIIEEYAHVAPGAVLCGEVYVGENTHIGANSIVRQRVNIGSNSVIGMGSVVLKDIDGGVVAFGNPCKEVSR